jgi:hypothetical protein
MIVRAPPPGVPVPRRAYWDYLCCGRSTQLKADAYNTLRTCDTSSAYEAGWFKGITIDGRNERDQVWMEDHKKIEMKNQTIALLLTLFFFGIPLWIWRSSLTWYSSLEGIENIFDKKKKGGEGGNYT